MRTPRVDKNGLKKGAWSAEEDRKLIDYINRYRIWNWSLMPKFAGLSRNGKSCRLRWVNYLDPNTRRGNITNEEENIIIDMYEKIGSRWSKIAAKLPGRSDNEIKNYWHTHLKKLFKEKPKKRVESLAIEIPKLEAVLENSYRSNMLIPSASASEGSNSQESNDPTMTPLTDVCDLDFQEIDQMSFDSSETMGDLNNFWTQPFFAGNVNMEHEEKELDVQEWYQEPLSPYGIFNNEYWLNEYQFMVGAEQPDVYYKDEFNYATIS